MRNRVVIVTHLLLHDAMAAEEVPKGQGGRGGQGNNRQALTYQHTRVLIPL